MSMLDGVQIVIGAVIVLTTLVDFFESTVLPRPAVGRLGPGRVVVEAMWHVWRRLPRRLSRVQTREAVLATFGPLSILAMLLLRAMLLVLGYGLILHALHGQLQDPRASLGTTLYLAGQALVTLGFGGVYPTGAVARALVLSEAAIGLGLVAVVVSFLFSIFSSFQRREVSVVTLDALAGAPPSGVQLLEAAAEYGMEAQLERTFDEWRTWTAEVLESHLAYPVLNYFRSSHDNEAWINSFGAVMDSAVLVLTTIDGGPKGPAKLMFKVGRHFVEDVSVRRVRYRTDGAPGIEREEFEEACERLRRAGYRVRSGDQAWESFARHRGEYASSLNQLARDLEIVPAPWIGDRSYLPHNR